MKSLLVTSFALLFLSAVLGPSAQAQSVLFDGSFPPGEVDDIGFNDPDEGLQRLAEDFQLANPATATGARFMGGYYPTNTPETDDFTLTIFGDAMGLPGNIVAEIPLGSIERTDTGVFALGVRLYSYHAEFAGVALEANSTYWFMIVNDTSNDENDGWVWAGRHGGGIFARSFDGGETWLDTQPGGFSFQVLGDEPTPTEPASWGNVKHRFR